MPPRAKPRPAKPQKASSDAESSRRVALQRLGALTGLTAIGGPAALLNGCGEGGGGSAMSVVSTDTTPPTVSATTPANGATGVALNSSVSATFSEPMNNAALNASFSLAPTAGGPAVAGTGNVSGNTATFIPSTNLAGSTQYTATISTGAKDAAGNALAASFTWSFTTPDTTPPTVSATSPVNGATGVALNPSVSATFSEPMNNATLNASFRLAPTAGGPAVAGTGNVSGNTATFTPSANLADSTQYTATISTAAKDAAGIALAANFTWSFTTSFLRLGAHNLVYNILGNPSGPVSTLPMNTQASGSTILVCAAKGTIASLSLPKDSFGNTYSQIGIAHPYVRWPGSGTALCAVQSGAGGIGHVVTAANTNDEVTIAVVEIKNAGVIDRVNGVKWSEVLAPPLTSLNIITTGPATLVAFWWGDANGSLPHTATPDDPAWNVIDSILDAGSLIQCAVATKDVTAAGSYNVTWIANQNQGAQLWLVAVPSS